MLLRGNDIIMWLLLSQLHGMITMGCFCNKGHHSIAVIEQSETCFHLCQVYFLFVFKQFSFYFVKINIFFIQLSQNSIMIALLWLFFCALML